MPSDQNGQMVSFASELDPDASYHSYIWIRALKGDTVLKIAARRGHPEMAHEIGVLNKIRSRYTKLKTHRLLKIPGTLAQSLTFDVHFQDAKRPVIKDGYAIYNVTARPGRIGLSEFMGYNPILMDIPVTFESWINRNGSSQEGKIAVLERMAGRGNYKGSASGPPAIIRVSCTDNNGKLVWLIPSNYQWSESNKTAPLWRIHDIAWDDAALSDDQGRRIRADCVITVEQYTPLALADTAASRNAPQVISKKLQPLS